MTELMKECEDHEEFVVSAEDVERVFAGVNKRKACGPDGMKGFVLKILCITTEFYIYIHFQFVYQRTYFTNHLENVRDYSGPQKS